MSGWIDAVIMLLCLGLGVVVLALLGVVARLRDEIDQERMRAAIDRNLEWNRGYNQGKKEGLAKRGKHHAIK